MLIFEEFHKNKKFSKLIFWAFLFSIIDIQVNKNQMIIIIQFFNDFINIEKEIKIKIDNILFFKEAIIKRITKLKIKTETQKLIKGNPIEKKLTEKDVNNMLIDELVLNFQKLLKILKKNDFSFYYVNVFFSITKKIVEYYSARNDFNYSYYLSEMKNILKNEKVEKIILNN